MTFVQNPGSGNPVFDYTSRDYTSILQDLLTRQQVYLPEWTSQSNNDFGIVLLQEFAYVGDLLGYYMDRLAGEAFIQTATQPQSILNLAALIGYTPYLSTGASVELTITISTSLGSYPLDIPAGSQFSTVGTATQAPIIFTTVADCSISNTISPTQAVAYVQSVAALQGTQYTSEAVATSNGAINQAYQLQNNPVSANSFTVYVDLGSGPQAWTYVDTLVGSGPFDLVFTNFVDANQNFFIVLGDGVNGYVPPLGSPVTCTYQTNDGGIGNVGANTITQYYGPPSGDSLAVGITAVTNALSATGGAYQESIASIQSQAPASLQALYRGITIEDINTLAKNIAGFAWASAAQQTYQLVNLYMAPNGGGSPTALQTATVESTVGAALMANTTLTVLPPTYQAVDISVNVVAFANYSNLATQQLIIQALDNLLALGNTGFAFRVALGLVYETVLGVPGVNYCAVEPITTADVAAFTTNPLGLVGNNYCSGLTREILCTLTTALSAVQPNQSVTTLFTTQVPQSVEAGDYLTITDLQSATPQSQIVQASGPVTGSAGLFSIPVVSFLPATNYAVGSPVCDYTVLEDCVFFANEIPEVGTLTINVTGGTTP